MSGNRWFADYKRRLRPNGGLTGMPACGYPPDPAGTNPQLAADKILARGNDAVLLTHLKKHQSRRPGYIVAWWNIVNWAQVADNFAQAKAYVPHAGHTVGLPLLQG